MTNHPTGAALLSFTLGSSSSQATEAILHHLNNCAPCQVVAQQIREDAGILALALTPIEPPALLRDTFKHALGEIHRLAEHVVAICDIARCPTEEARQLLEEIDSPRLWRRQGDVFVLEWTPTVGRAKMRPPLALTLVRMRPRSTLRWQNCDEDTVWGLFCRAHLLILQGACQIGSQPPMRSGDRATINQKITERESAPAAVALAGPDVILLAAKARAPQPRVRPLARSQAKASNVSERGLPTR